MFEFLKRKKNRKESENSQSEHTDPVGRSAIKTGVGLTATKSAEASVNEAAKTFAKPDNYTGNRHLYDDHAAKHNAKLRAFEDGSATDPYTGETLTMTKAEAIDKYGSKWADHLAETDHITPIEKIHNEHHNDPWLTNDDIRGIANSDDNLEAVSRRFNNAKRSRTNEEFVTDEEYLSRTGVELSQDGKRKAIESGKRAQKAVDKQARKASFKNAMKTGHNAGIDAAKASGVMGGTMSGITNIVQVIKGEKTAGQAVADTAKDTAKATVTGYAMGNGLTVVSHTLSNSSSKFLRALSDSNVPGKVITAVMVTGDTLKRYADGRITTQECILELGEKGLNFATAGYSMAMGQALIPIPVVGAAIGALVGSVATDKLYHELIGSLQNKQLEKKERERIIAECELIAEQERAYRAELEAYLDEYFADYRDCFDSALGQIEAGFASGDADSVIAGANKITRKLGGKVNYETVDEFKDFLFDDSVDVL